jgi:hypothetical protein
VNSEKYIGLDVHHAIISVAVLDSTGKVVMKSILETKAATILQFFAELRGTLSVTLEEGTWAAWLYDLLKPHVANLVVCNPRKDALLKQGNKSDRIDARKLADLLRGNHLKPVYHGETGVCTQRELARSYLTTVKDLTRVMSRLKAVYRSWAIPCAGRDVYYGRHRAEWLGKIKGGWGSAESRATELAPGHAAAVAATSSPRVVGGKPEASHYRQVSADSVRGADSISAVGGTASDPESFSQQAATLGLQRSGVRDSHQRRPSLCPRPIATLQETNLHSWTEQGPQPRPKRFVQSRGHDGQCASWTVPGLLSEIAGQRHQANNGASDAGTQDRSHYADSLEEGRRLRRGKIEIASRLSVSGKSPFHLR